jgi:hypothetical protein
MGPSVAGLITKMAGDATVILSVRPVSNLMVLACKKEKIE